MKLKKMYRCRRGDIAAQEMIECDIQKNDFAFNAILQRNQVLADNFEFLVFQKQNQDFSRMPTEQEAKESFENVFEEMVNSTFREIFLNRCTYTHLSLGFRQVGQSSETFKVACLLSKKPLSVNVIASSIDQVDGPATIFVGHIFDFSKLPVMVIINRGKSSELKLGTNKILFDPKVNEEFKFWFFNNQTQGINPFQDANVPRNEISVDIYTVDSNRGGLHDFEYGQGNDVDQGINPDDQGWQLSYSDRVPASIKDIALPPFQALQEKCLQTTVLGAATGKQSGTSRNGLINRLQKGQKASNTIAVGAMVKEVNNTSSNVIQPKKTRAQLLKEQKAKEVLERQNNHRQMGSTAPAIPLGPNQDCPNMQNFNNQNQPSFNKIGGNENSQNINSSSNKQQNLNFSVGQNNFQNFRNQGNSFNSMQAHNSSQNTFHSRGNFSFGQNNLMSTNLKQQTLQQQNTNDPTSICGPNGGVNQNLTAGRPQFNFIQNSNQQQICTGIGQHGIIQNSNAFQITQNSNQHAQDMINQNASAIFNQRNTMKTQPNASNFGQSQSNQQARVTSSKKNFQIIKPSANQSKQQQSLPNGSLNEQNLHNGQSQKQQMQFQFNLNQPKNDLSGLKQEPQAFQAFRNSKTQQLQKFTSERRKPPEPQPQLVDNARNQAPMLSGPGQAAICNQFFQNPSLPPSLPPQQPFQVNPQAGSKRRVWNHHAQLPLANNGGDNITSQLVRPAPILTPLQPQNNQNIVLNEAQQKALLRLRPYMDLQTEFKIDELTLLKYIKELEQQNLSIEEQNMLYNKLENEPLGFLEMVKQAHLQLEKNRQKESQEKMLARQFREQVLFSNEIGLYLLRITEAIPRIDEIEYDSMLSTYESGYATSRQNGAIQSISEAQGQEYCFKILKSLILKKLPPKNESFSRLYEDHLKATEDPTSREAATSDLTLLLQGQKFRCHQFVFKMNSKYFDDLIAKNQEIDRKKASKFNRYDRIEYINRQRFELPERQNANALKLFIKFLYLGHLSPIHQDADFKSMLNLYLTAYFFRHYILEDHVVIEGLIPKITLKTAIQCLIELKKLQNDPKRESKILVEDYCIHIIARNLTRQLRQERRALFDLDQKQLSSIVQRSLLYLKGDEQMGQTDLALILSFAADMFADRDLHQLLLCITHKYRKATAFDLQSIKKIREFMADIEPKQNYFCGLIQNEKGSKESDPTDKNLLQLEQAASSPSKKEEQKTFCLSNKTLNLSRIVEDPHHDGSSPMFNLDIDFEEWKPKNNIVLDRYGRIQPSQGTQLREIAAESRERKPEIKLRYANKKQTCFEDNIRVGTLREECRKWGGKGTSLFTKAFDSARRSWHLKIDFEANENLSLWIVERGLPIDENLINQNFLIPNFSSIILEFEIYHKSMGEKSTPIFYSFAHNSNQIIGQKNILNVQNLQNSDHLQIRVHMRELILHSAIMQHMCFNFTMLYKQASNQSNNNQISNNRANMLTLPFPLIYQMLKSNFVKVEDENTLLGFIFNYVEKLDEHLANRILFNLGKQRQKSSVAEMLDVKAQKKVRGVTGLLVQALRYNFLCLRKILSAIRKSQWMRGSKQFIDRLRAEMNFRVHMTTSLNSMQSQSQNTFGSFITGQSHTNQNLQEEDVRDELRQFYDLIKIKSQGRNKVNDGGNNDAVGLLEEVVNWAITASVSDDRRSKFKRNDDKDRFRYGNDQIRQLNVPQLCRGQQDRQREEYRQQERHREDRFNDQGRRKFVGDPYQLDEERRNDFRPQPIGHPQFREPNNLQDQMDVLKIQRQLDDFKKLERSTGNINNQPPQVRPFQLKNVNNGEQQRDNKRRNSRSLPKFLQGKENRPPINEDSFKSVQGSIRSPSSPKNPLPRVPQAYNDTQAALHKIQREKIDTDYTCIFNQMNNSLSPIRPNVGESFDRIRPQPIPMNNNAPRNPMVTGNGNYQMRTRLPTASNQQQQNHRSNENASQCQIF